jgi:hypothetical protein
MQASGQLVTLMLWLLNPQGKSPGTSINKRLGGSRASLGTTEKTLDLLPLPGIKPQLIGHPANSVVPILAELFQLALHFIMKRQSLLVLLHILACLSALVCKQETYMKPAASTALLAAYIMLVSY